MAQKHRWKRWALAVCAALIVACSSPSGGGAAPDFALALSPAALTVSQGESAPIGIGVERKNGFSGEVMVSLVNPPAGISAPSVTIPAASASGSLTISVDASATTGKFALTVRGQSGSLSRTAQLELTVVAENGGQEELPVIHAFSASPPAIAPGEWSTLSWSVTGANNLRIDPGIGEVTGSSVTVSPGKTTEYTLTASNAAGARTAKTTVTVTANGGGNAQIHAFFLPLVTKGQTIYNTLPARVAVDAKGGVHVAYSVVDVIGQDSRVIYGYCPSDCTDQSRFATVALGADEADLDLNLVLDPQGRPRMLWHSLPGHRYAECDANCTDPSSWRLTTTPTLHRDLYGGSKRQLALDAQGRPRFVFMHDGGATPATGTYFVWCDASCTNEASWQEARISPYRLKSPMLSLTPAGLPRLAAYDSYQVGGKEQELLVYLECDAGCGSEANWTETPLHPLNPTLGGAFAMQLDGQGRPRLALYTGDLEAGLGLEPKALYYLWCDGACSDGNNWQGYKLPFGELGMHLDLALDGQGRPRLAFDGVYAWCDAGCATSTASWQSLEFDSSSSLNKEWPIPPGPGCQFASWSLWGEYTLALDHAGGARIGYEARHSEVCNGSVHTNYRLARFAALRWQ